MKTIELSEHPELEPMLEEVQSERAVLTRNGKAVALLSPLDADDAEWLALESDPAFGESLRRADDDISRGRFFTHEQVKKELGLA